MRTVAIEGPCSQGELRVLAALAQANGLRVEANSTAAKIAGRIVILDKSTAAGAPEGDREGISCLRIFRSSEAQASRKVELASQPDVPWPFRGAQLTSHCVVPAEAPKLAGQPAATAEGRVIWTIDRGSGGNHASCWVSRDWAGENDCVYERFNGDRLMNLLPAFEWFRTLSDWHLWQHPPVRACFMFDDPNLHDVRYGFIDFGRLAEEGTRHRYHTSFATVPLDGYYVNARAARIFRENGATLSFLVHGNNHTYRELATSQPFLVKRAMMHQAVARIQRVEQRSGLKIPRVMAPPHGICSADMMRAMVDAGFEAVCVSHGSVHTGNPGVAWTAMLGTMPTTVVAGLPVIPRFGMDRDPRNKVLLAAYLRQPIIPVGHHWDVSNGLDILSDGASAINALGEVQWSNMAQIARGNYATRSEGKALRVRLLSRTALIQLPAGAEQLVLEGPLAGENITCRDDSGAELSRSPDGGFAFPERETRRVTVSVRPPKLANEEAVRYPGTSAKVVARRILVEIRDRLMPSMPRKLRRG